MTAAEAAPRGRPRDPELEQRVYAAVLTLYAERGWSGFTLDAVARTAPAGRAALYRRWSSKAELLVAALEATAPPIPPIDTGSVEGDLVELVSHLMSSYTQPAGMVGLRAALDARTHPELLAPLSATLQGTRLASARALLQRAVRRGELPRGTPATLLLEVLSGAALSHVLFVPGAAAPSEVELHRHARRLVELLLRAYR